MKRITTILFILIFGIVFSQKILSKYPEGQFAYKDGSNQMFTEMQNFFVKSGLKPCEKNEMYWVTLKIDETGKPFLIKKNLMMQLLRKINVLLIWRLNHLEV